MKICVLTHTFPRNKEDVAAAFMKEFCDGLVQNGNKVSVVTPYDPEFNRKGDPFKIHLYKYIYPDSLHTLGYSRTMEADVKLKKNAYILLPFMLGFGFVKTLQVIRKEKPDIISVHWILPNGVVAYAVSKLTGVPYAITLPGTDTYLAAKYKPFGYVAKIIANGSVGMYSNSSWHLNKIVKVGGSPPVKEVITYPVDIKKFKPINKGLDIYRKKYKIKQNEKIILAVGRLVYKKGFDYLIKSIPQVAKKHKNIKVIIGGDGDLRKEWENLAKKLKVDKYIIFTGTLKRDEIIYYYNMADIMVTPSILDSKGNIDGRPLVILESMACGKPQIVTNLPGISDNLKDGENAILVPEKNSKAIANAIIKLLGSSALREKMGKANIKLARQKLSTKSVGKMYTKSFTKILKDHK